MNPPFSTTAVWYCPELDMANALHVLGVGSLTKKLAPTSVRDMPSTENIVPSLRVRMFSV